MLFITGLGIILYLNGVALTITGRIDSVNLLFAGALLATLFWVSGYANLSSATIRATA